MSIIKKGEFSEGGFVELDAKRIEEILREKSKREKEHLGISEEAPYGAVGEDLDRTIEGNIELLKEVEESVVRSKTEKIIKDADEKIKSMWEKARSEIEEQKVAAKEEGFKAGQKEGLESVAVKVKEAMGIISGAVREKNKIIGEARSEILKLSLKIAEQIIRSEISLNQGICMNIVSEAIGKITDRDNVVIKVNRSDLDYTRKNRDRLAELIDGVKNLNIQEDTSVEPGGCVIETDLGYVDGRISTKLESIKTALERTYEDEKLKEAEGKKEIKEEKIEEISEDIKEEPEEEPEEERDIDFLDNI